MRLYLRIQYIAASGHFLTTFESKEHEGKRLFCIGNARPKNELILACLNVAFGRYLGEGKGPAMEAILQAMKRPNFEQIVS